MFGDEKIEILRDFRRFVVDEKKRDFEIFLDFEQSFGVRNQRRASKNSGKIVRAPKSAMRRFQSREINGAPAKNCSGPDRVVPASSSDYLPCLAARLRLQELDK